MRKVYGGRQKFRKEGKCFAKPKSTIMRTDRLRSRRDRQGGERTQKLEKKEEKKGKERDKKKP